MKVQKIIRYILFIFVLTENHIHAMKETSPLEIPASNIETWQQIKRDIMRADLIDKPGQKIKRQEAIKRILKRMAFATTAIIIAIKGNVAQNLVKPLEELRNKVDILYKTHDIQKAITESRILIEKTGELADQVLELLQKKGAMPEFKERKEIEEINSETINTLQTLKSDIDRKKLHVGNINTYNLSLSVYEAGSHVDDVRRLIKKTIDLVKSLEIQDLKKDLDVLESEFRSLEKSLDAIENSSNKRDRKGYISLYKITCANLLKKAGELVDKALKSLNKS